MTFCEFRLSWIKTRSIHFAVDLPSFTFPASSLWWSRSQLKTKVGQSQLKIKMMQVWPHLVLWSVSFCSSAAIKWRRFSSASRRSCCCLYHASSCVCRCKVSFSNSRATVLNKQHDSSTKERPGDVVVVCTTPPPVSVAVRSPSQTLEPPS